MAGPAATKKVIEGVSGMGQKCQKCGCTEIWDEDCPECSGGGEAEDGSECLECDGSGYHDGYCECSQCGEIDMAHEFDD